jgi:hypothetical protein
METTDDGNLEPKLMAFLLVKMKKAATIVTALVSKD